jgi:hypothetical protein
MTAPIPLCLLDDTRVQVDLAHYVPPLLQEFLSRHLTYAM